MIIGSTPFFIFKAILFFAGVFFLFGIFYVAKRMSSIREKNNPKPAPKTLTKTLRVKTDQWGIVEKHASSENPGEWRLAIIEADTILEEAVKRMGYEGDTLGERMKKIDRSMLRSIDEAWDAHKVRNLIAHKGSAYVLSKREAKRVIGLYEKVFREIEFI